MGGRDGGDCPEAAKFPSPGIFTGSEEVAALGTKCHFLSWCVRCWPWQRQDVGVMDGGLKASRQDPGP